MTENLTNYVDKYRSRTSFGLIEKVSYLLREDAKGVKRMESLEVTLSEWLFQALEKKNILTISDQYFSLRKPLEKRLYELARKHVGTAQPQWIIKEENLLEKTGSRSQIGEFRRMLGAIIKEDTLPDYSIERFVSEGGETKVRFYPRSAKDRTLLQSVIK